MDASIRELARRRRQRHHLLSQEIMKRVITIKEAKDRGLKAITSPDCLRSWQAVKALLRTYQDFVPVIKQRTPAFVLIKGSEVQLWAKPLPRLK